MVVKATARYQDLQLNREVQIGETLEVTDERAAQLVALKLVQAISPTVPAEPPQFNLLGDDDAEKRRLAEEKAKADAEAKAKAEAEAKAKADAEAKAAAK